MDLDKRRLTKLCANTDPVWGSEAASPQSCGERKKKCNVETLLETFDINGEKCTRGKTEESPCEAEKPEFFFSERLNSTAAAIRLEYKVHLLAEKKMGRGEVGGVGEQIGLHVTLLVIK